MTQLYLISLPKIELADFRKSLEAALKINNECDARSVDRASPERASSARQEPSTEAKKMIGAFQLRLKDVDDTQIKAAIKELMPICQAHEVAFILNDRSDLCAEFKCDGVHVGQEDLLNASGAGYCLPHEAALKAGESADSHDERNKSKAMQRIRSIIGEEAVLGITCHASRHLAMEAGEAGADYVAFGAFYPTTSKPKEKLEKWGTPTPDIIEWWTTFATLPCVAIGGITPANCKPLVSAGADFIAVINAVWNHPRGVQAAILEFKKEML